MKQSDWIDELHSQLDVHNQEPSKSVVRFVLVDGPHMLRIQDVCYTADDDVITVELEHDEP